MSSVSFNPTGTGQMTWSANQYNRRGYPKVVPGPGTPNFQQGFFRPSGTGPQPSNVAALGAQFRGITLGRGGRKTLRRGKARRSRRNKNFRYIN